MRLMLTSCGLETEKIKGHFLEMLGKDPRGARALFIPTAAIDADAVGVLPKCMNDLLRAGIPKENIRVFDLHADMPAEELGTLMWSISAAGEPPTCWRGSMTPGSGKRCCPISGRMDL